MRTTLFMMVVCMLFLSATTMAQPPRTDVKWGRTTTETMTVNGVLSEAGWAAAESVKITYGLDSGMPGSGWFRENGLTTPQDSTKATVKFLVKGDSLFVGIRVLDKSVVGGPFNRFDGILSNIRRREQTNRPTGSGELFYAWVKEGWADSLADQPGRLPYHAGTWPNPNSQTTRPDSLRRIWEGATTVQGTQNNDLDVDVGYTIELKINLNDRGYNVTAPAGDILQYSISIYDNDWPADSTRQAGNRAWFQCPWGNNDAYGHIRLYVRPDVTVSSGPVPAPPAYELRVPGANYPTMTLDGLLNESVWQNPGVGTLQIQFGNATIRNAYPYTAPYRSGQFQPAVNGGTAFVADPTLATIKYFYKGDSLYLGFDVSDLVVQAVGVENRWDGFRISINDRVARDASNVIYPRGLTFRIDGSGTNLIVAREDDIAPLTGRWDSAGTKVQIAAALKPGTTIDTLGQSPDVGYTAEMRVNLRQLGYPAGRGDGVLFFGATLFDGDSFTPASDSYGTRTWFMRERAGSGSPIWGYMDPSNLLAVDGQGNTIPDVFTLLGNYPNPFNPSTTIKFVMPQTSDVRLEVFNLLGQRVASHLLGEQQVGERSVQFNASHLATGMYMYRLTMNATNASVAGKMMILK